ncbi:MAG: DUF2339 domain-containing protein [Gammaproteobacteria bacterium]|nr:DUF2339 domain-containing protein [Gammaproteobacteria bacterium]
MTIIGTIIGALLGAFVGHDVEGFLLGAVLGYLIAELVEIKSRIVKLEHAPKREGAVPTVIAVNRPVSPTATSTPGVHQPTPIVSSKPITPAPIPTVSQPASTPARQSAPPAVPNPIDVAINFVREFFTGGNTLVRIGIVILFFGVAFLLKYAAEHAYFPIELRLSGTALGAVALLVIGARLRRKRAAYGLILEGGAIGILYLVIFAAFRLYALLPASFAFFLLLAICALSAALAMLQNSLALALFGAAGGFLAPVLTSTGHGSHVMLFSYYAILNLGIFAIAWFKAWRPLNVVGFGFTFVIGSSWGYRYYQPEFFSTTEPFLIFFFLLYVAVALLYARRQPPELQHPVDGTLVFGVPVVGFLLQVGLVKSYEYGVAWSALALGGFYLGLAGWLLRHGAAKLLAEAFVALGVIFATLTIPLAVDGHWTAAAWAIEGAGILWIGLRQSRLLARAFGLLVQLGGGVLFMAAPSPPVNVAVLNSTYIGVLLVSVAGVISAFLLSRYRDRATSAERALAVPLLVWGVLWWYGGTVHEIGDYVGSAHRVTVWLLVITGASIFFEWIGRRVGWIALRYTAAANSVHLALSLAWAAMLLSHPFAGFGLVAWTVALVVHYLILKGHENAELNLMSVGRHVGALWTLLVLLGWEVYWQVDQWLPYSDWSIGALGLCLALALIGLLALSAHRWPINRNVQAYLVVGAVPIAGVALVWMLLGGVVQPGNSAPLAFVPILNPIDMAALFVFIAMLRWSMTVRALVRWPLEPLAIGFGVVVFAWLNAVLFRTLHHVAQVPYTLNDMLDSMLVQSAISIFWTVLAFVLMLAAARVRLRYLWFVGATLLGIVVVKLFTVELSNTGTVARIVSFVGVGVLLLVIGYFVPIPPKVEQAEVAS